MPDPAKDPWAVPDAPAPSTVDSNEVVTVNKLGVRTQVRRKDLGPEDQEVNPGIVAAEQSAAAQRAAFDNLGDKVLTFAEGAVDAASFGALRERSQSADVRRDVNSGSFFAGGLAGNIALMKAPSVVSLGADAAKLEDTDAVAKLVSDAAHPKTIIQQATHEAAIAAALSGAGATGHQAFDSILEDKDFSVEAVLKETGLGAMLGFGLGLMGGSLSHLSERAPSGEVQAAQGGLADPSSQVFHSAIDETAGAIRSMDEQLKVHAARVEGASAINAREHFNLEAQMQPRQDALAKAVAARAKLPDNVVASMKNADPVLSKGIDDYVDALNDLDKVMTLNTVERFQPQVLGEGLSHDAMDAKFASENERFQSGAGQIEGMYKPGEVPLNNIIVNTRMRDPELQAQYRALHGRDWAPVDEGAGLDALPEQMGTPSATPEAGTNVGKRRPTPAPEADAASALDAFNAPEGTQVSAMPEGMKFPGGPADTAVQAAAASPRPLADTGMSQLNDGAMMPTVDAQANAQAFSDFQKKFADDTMLRKAHKADSMAKFKAEQALERAKAEPPAQGLSRGKGPEYRDTDVESTQGIRDRNNQHAIDASLAQDIKEQAAVPKAGDAPDRGLAALNELLGVKDEPAPAKSGPSREDYQFMERWWHESQKMGPKASPGDIAAVRIQAAADRLYGATDGRADSVAALDLASAHGMHEARSPLAVRVQQVQLLPHAVDAVAKIAQVAGQVAKEGKAAPTSGKMGNWVKRKIGGSLGAKAGLALGGPIGGIMGYQLGAEALTNYTRAATQMATATGRAAMRVAQVAEKLLSGHKPSALAATVANKAYAYSEEGPIQDPVERILEVQRVAGNPDAVREAVRKQMGDLPVVHPGLAQKLEDHAVAQVTAISIKAPHIYFDQMGDPQSPTMKEMREFLEYEGAAHNIDRTLNRIGSGVATPVEVQAAHELVPVHMQRLVQSVLDDPERLKRLPMEQRRSIEAQTGIPLTNQSNIPFMQQQMAAWEKATAQAQGKNNPQALTQGAKGMSTPAQGGLSGRAPGN